MPWSISGACSSTVSLIKVFEIVECGGPGGTGHQVAALCRGLDPQRFSVTLVFAVRSGSPEEYASSAGEAQAYHIPEMVRKISPFDDIRALIKLYRLFSREKPDVVHAHSSKAGFLARIAARLAGIPRIYYSPRGYGFLQEDCRRFTRLFYRILEWSVSGIGEIIAISPSEKTLAESLSGGRPVRLVCDPYLGDWPAEHGNATPGKLLVGACGRLTYARNPEAFVVLCQRLTDSRNGLSCLWIGGGEGEGELRRHLENMNLTGKVEITGWLASSEARARLRELDIFIHYSRWEGLPNAVLEAMAHGLPVVASDVPGNRDAVIHGNTGFLARSEIELLERALELADNPALRRRMGSAGRKRVLAEFSREACHQRLAEIYAG